MGRIDVIKIDDLATLLPDYAVRQRWFAGADVEGLEVVAHEVLRDEWPGLVWVLFRVGNVTYQELVGLRPLEQTERFLEGKGRSYLGDIDTEDGIALAYSALVDPELALMVARVVAPDEQFQRARPLTVEQSNTSVVFDERLIMKLYRRIADGPNPDVEVTEALGDVGFQHIAAPVAVWQREGRHLAVVSHYLEGGTEGWQLALTSLRDIYDSRLEPAESGGDIGPELRRLGQVTAELHLALADALRTEPGDPSRWADELQSALTKAAGFDIDRVQEVYEALRSVRDPGQAIRIHGDYHLGQVLRTDYGWFVLDFEGEPLVPLEQRRHRASPLRDVAGMLRSFHYASEAARIERHEALGDEDQQQLVVLAEKWEAHVSAAFLEGYLGAEGVGVLLPTDQQDLRSLLDALVLGKAVYEVGYERDHRPDWVRIPLGAIERVLAAAAD
jgi:maltokinase